MRIQKFNKGISKFQMGGEMPQDPNAQAPMEQEAGQVSADQDAMIQQLSQMAAQVIQSVGPEAAAMLAQIIMEMIQGGQAPIGEPQEGEPVFKKGGKLCGRMKKKAKMNKGGKC